MKQRNQKTILSENQIQELIERESDLRSLLEKATNFAVYRAKVDSLNKFGGNIVMVSPSLTEITGIEDRNNFDSWFENIHPEDLARITKANQRAWEDKVPYNEEARFYNKQKGKWVWVRTSSYPTLDENGNITHFNGLVFDITKEKQTEETLKYQSNFEKLITGISTKFINLKAEQINTGISQALQDVGAFTGIDRGYIFLFSDDDTTLSNTHEWCADGIEPLLNSLQNIPYQDLKWSNDKLKSGEILYLQSLEELPSTAMMEKELFATQGIQSLIAIPMEYQGRVIGFMGFDSIKTPIQWSDECITLLKMVGEVIGNALALKKAQEAQRRQQEFLELLASEGTFHETLDALIGIIEKQAPGMLGLILLLDDQDQTLHIGAAHQLAKEYLDEIEGLHIGPYVGSCGTAAYTGERVIVTDIDTDPRWEGLKDTALIYGLRACWSKPFFSSEGNVIGTFAMYFRQPRKPSENELHIIETAAHLAGVAVQHKRSREKLEQAKSTLEQKVVERTSEIDHRRRVAESLRELLSALNSNKSLDDILDLIVIQSKTLLGASATMLRRGDLKKGVVTTEASCNLPADYEIIRETPLTYREGDKKLIKDDPLVISDIAATLGLDANNPDVPEIHREWIKLNLKYYKSYLAIPLTIEGHGFGNLTFYFEEQQEFSEEDIQIARSLADQASLAIQNAQLRSQAEKSAVTAERNRLARDLHDAVTQTLFSASLIAEVLPRIWEKNEIEGRRRLQEIRELTRGALAEMRTLLMELRPKALMESEIDELFRQLTDAFIGRTRIPVHITIQKECELNPDVRVAMYRIAQESLNNIAKHAKASQVDVHLICKPDQVELMVRDNGRGFDINEIPPDHLGVGIMRERAESIGAELHINSQKQQGTEITAIWKDQRRNYE